MGKPDNLFRPAVKPHKDFSLTASRPIEFLQPVFLYQLTCSAAKTWPYRSESAKRLFCLDPKERFWPLHGKNVEYFLGEENCKFNTSRKLTITYCVGGAGAQKEIGKTIALSLKEKITSRRCHLIFSEPEQKK